MSGCIHFLYEKKCKKVKFKKAKSDEAHKEWLGLVFACKRSILPNARRHGSLEKLAGTRFNGDRPLCNYTIFYKNKLIRILRRILRLKIVKI